MSDDLKAKLKSVSFGGLGATALVFIFTTFMQKDDANARFDRIERHEQQKDERIYQELVLIRGQMTQLLINAATKNEGDK